MPPALSQDPRPAERPDGEEPSWADKVADILRRIFVPGERAPQPVLVPPRLPAARTPAPGAVPERLSGAPGRPAPDARAGTLRGRLVGPPGEVDLQRPHRARLPGPPPAPGGCSCRRRRAGPERRTAPPAPRSGPPAPGPSAYPAGAPAPTRESRAPRRQAPGRSASRGGCRCPPPAGDGAPSGSSAQTQTPRGCCRRASSRGPSTSPKVNSPAPSSVETAPVARSIRRTALVSLSAT